MFLTKCILMNTVFAYTKKLIFFYPNLFDFFKVLFILENSNAKLYSLIYNSINLTIFL